LIQTAGRAARNVNGMVIMYADTISQAIKATIDECERRRKIQLAFNKEHGITPQTIQKAIADGIEELTEEEAQEVVREAAGLGKEDYVLSGYITELEQDMERAARNLQFEKAAAIRDRIAEIKGINKEKSKKAVKS
jgi:excinuclease ABC subunit B